MNSRYDFRFALPDFVLRDGNKRPEQPFIARKRYEFVRRVFNNEFSRVANWDLDTVSGAKDPVGLRSPDSPQSMRDPILNPKSEVLHIFLFQNLENDDLDDQCFLLRALSHTYEEHCPQNYSSNGRLPLGQNGQNDPFGNNQQDSNQQQQNRFQSKCVAAVKSKS